MKRMTRAQFMQTANKLSMGANTRAIAEGVLVDGKPQIDYARAKKITPGAVSQIVNRVWKTYLRAANIPDKFVEVTVILPEHQAFIVKQWEREAKNAIAENQGDTSI